MSEMQTYIAGFQHISFYSLLMSSLVMRHHYHFLSLRLVRNPSGFSERFPTSGNDIDVALLIAVLVTDYLLLNE